MATRIFRTHRRLSVAVLAGMELMIFISALLLAALLQIDASSIPVARRIADSLTHAPLFLGVMSIAMASTGLYNERQPLTPAGLLTRVAVAAMSGALMMAAISRSTPDLRMGGDVLVFGALFVIAGSFCWHFLLGRMTCESASKRRVIVYGAGRRAASLLQLPARENQRGVTIVGFIPSVSDEPSADVTQRIIELHSSLHEYCRIHAVREIVVAMDDSRWGIPFNAFLECRFAGIEVTDLTAFLERETGKVRVDLAHPSWTIFAGGFGRSSLQVRLERVFDVIASLVLLVLTFPVVALTILAIKLEDGFSAPVLYRQVRVGERGQLFALLKFRSMREDAEQDGQARWAVVNDDRVTRVGRVIRKLRIDELPQLLNVLTGEMSLVGPRPERPEFVSLLDRKIPFYWERHTIKPGITGWAQLCYPYGSDETDAAEKLQYDLFYVKNRTLLFYLAILLQTVEVVLWRKGAR